MTISLLGTSTVELNNQSTANLTWPGSITANSIAVITVANWKFGASVIPVTPSGFTERVNADIPNGNRAAVYYKECTGSESGSLAVSLSNASFAGWTLAVWDGTNDLTLDTTNSASTLSTGTADDATAASVSGTTGQLLVGCYNLSDPPGTTNTDPSGMSAVVSSAFTTSSSRIYSQTLSSTGATGTKTWDYSNSRDYGAMLLLISEAGGGGTPNISSTSSANPAHESLLTITGTNFGASGGSVALGGITQTVISWSATSIVIRVNRGTNKYGTALNVVVTDSSAVDSNSYALTSILPWSGWDYIDIGTPNTSAANRLTASPDLVSGDQVSYTDFGGLVEVISDGTFTADTYIAFFKFEVWSSTGGGWGTTADQTLFISGRPYGGLYGKTSTQPVLGRAKWPGSGIANLALIDAIFERDSGEVSGTVSITLDNTTLSGQGTTTVLGSVGLTLGSTTLAANGTTTVVGTLSRTLDDTTLSASGSVGAAVSGDVVVTLDSVTLSASGTTTIIGTVSTTLAATTLAAQGTTTILGTVSSTLGDTTLAANGSIGGAVSGSLSITLADTTLSSQGTTTVVGTINSILADATLASNGTSTILGTLSQTLANATLAATGIVGTPPTTTQWRTLTNAGP
jgi:trimeric autotransporter adhesin